MHCENVNRNLGYDPIFFHAGQSARKYPNHHHGHKKEAVWGMFFHSEISKDPDTSTAPSDPESLCNYLVLWDCTTKPLGIC